MNEKNEKSAVTEERRQYMKSYLVARRDFVKTKGDTPKKYLPKTTAEERHLRNLKMVELWEGGMTQSDIAKEMGLTVTQTGNMIRRIKQLSN